MTPDELVAIRIELQNMNKYLRDTMAVSAATREMGVAATAVGTGFGRATRRGFILQQLLFTLRRYIYSATLGLTALAGVGVAWGISFNASMEQNTTAFTMFLGSEAKARKELAFLYDLAKKTPFEFADVVDATRKFLAFGFSVDETNTYLRIIADTAAAFGMSKEGIDRFVLAIGQMRAANRVLGGELRQLTELGIPARKILREQLGLTDEQMKNIGNLGIPADVGIQAIMRGLMQMRGVMGASERQAKTFNGQMSTLRDNTRQLAGEMTKAWFDQARTKWLPSINALTQEMKAGFHREGLMGAIKAMDEHFHAGGKLVFIYRELRFSFKLLTQAIKLAAQNIHLLTTALIIYIGYVIAAKIVTMALAIATKIKAFWDKIAWLWQSRHNAAIAIAVVVGWARVAALRATFFWERLVTIWTAISTGVMKLYRLSIILVALALFLWRNRMIQILALEILLTTWTWLVTAATWAWNIALYANPIGLIILGIVLLVAAIALLIWKWDALVKKVKELWRWLGKLGGRFDIIRNVMRWSPWGMEIRGAKWFGGKLGLASGGSVTHGGFFDVGERGRETVFLPAGAAVQPRALGSLQGDGPIMGTRELIVPITVNLDGKKVGEAVARRYLDTLGHR